MKTLSRLGASLLALFLLSACAGKNPIPFDHARAGSIKTVGIVTPSIPENASSVIAATPGKSFGLIGALIDAGMKSNRDDALAAGLRTQAFSAQTTFTEQLANALRARGYEVVMVPVEREKKGEFLPKYPTNHPVDAYLDVVSSGYGYMAAGISDSTPFRPFVVVQCQLVGKGASPILMQDRVIYNPIGNQEKSVTLAPDPSVAFTSSDAMEKKSQDVANGLRLALGQTADAVGGLLQ